MDAFPPFDPNGAPEEDNGADARGPRLREIPLRMVWPNLITTLAICAGLTGVRFAIEGEFQKSVMLVLLAAFLDGIDGRIARMLKASSKFGMQMDSLADIVNFGVVPALVIWLYFLGLAPQVGWIAALIYAIACALRLARFNVMSENPGRAKWQGEYFVGVPAPAGALLVLLPVYLGLAGFEPGKASAYFFSAYTVCIAFLLVSRLPVWSGKALGLKVPRTAVIPIILLVALAIMLLAAFTFEMLILVAIAYLVALPVSAMAYRRREKRELAAAHDRNATPSAP
ncbi:CDP-diacylglycerol--serine O-phosphatidyltransferase [Zhengella mangrovi]|uniref:CDP-diacylglycerol--serine O-phosphatidyltransferase n=1 Tax=Zhengella mangrovi TaxID=1982044 RepID=A0A2G1QS30_9HYPH|nr:CDP-diacylglycerol--serine O-phosphatidyltransferase [Zhengella mangrovi]PHP68264.1 CDP-diacylglycerol--serine O-phosphatidyltransferase [Zhengella mangrovi]